MGLSVVLTVHCEMEASWLSTNYKYTYKCQVDGKFLKENLESVGTGRAATGSTSSARARRGRPHPSCPTTASCSRSRCSWAWRPRSSTRSSTALRRTELQMHGISEEPQRGGRLRERVSAVREQLPGTRLNLGCRLNLHNYSLHGLQPGVLMSGHLGV